MVIMRPLPVLFSAGNASCFESRLDSVFCSTLTSFFAKVDGVVAVPCAGKLGNGGVLADEAIGVVCATCVCFLSLCQSPFSIIASIVFGAEAGYKSNTTGFL